MDWENHYYYYCITIFLAYQFILREWENEIENGKRQRGGEGFFIYLRRYVAIGKRGPITGKVI